MISLSTSQMKIIKAIGYPVFFFCCYALFLTLTFPAERFLPVAEVQLSKVLGREVTIDDLAVSPLGSVTLTGVTIEVPSDEEQKKTGALETDASQDTATGSADSDSEAKKSAPKPIVPRYYIEKMHVSVSVWSLIFGDLNVSVAADFLGGDILVNYTAPIGGGEAEEPAGEEADLADLPPGERAKISRERRVQKAAQNAGKQPEEGREMSFSIVATGLNLVQFWDLKDLLPLPMFGALDFSIDLKTATGKMADAEGKMWIDGRNISLGQGQSKVEIIDGMGPMTIDSFGISELQMEMKAVKGKFIFDKVKMVSNDIAATAQGDVQFADPISLSRLNLYFTFKLLEGYASKSPNAQTLVSLMPSALSRARRTDDSYGFIYQGILKTAKFRPQKTFGIGDRPARTTSRRSTRPPTRGRSVSRQVQPPAVGPKIASPATAVPPSTPEPPPVNPPVEHPLAPPTPSGRITPLKEMAEEMQERQAESESKRAEAALRAREAMEAEMAEEEEPEDVAPEPDAPGENENANEEEGDAGEEGSVEPPSPESEDAGEEGGEEPDGEGEVEVEEEPEE